MWHTPLFKLRTHRKKQNHLPRSFDLLKLFGDFHIENQTDAAADALHFLTFIFKMFFLRSINWWLLAFKLWCGLPFPLFILLQTLSLSLSLSLSFKAKLKWVVLLCSISSKILHFCRGERIQQASENLRCKLGLWHGTPHNNTKCKSLEPCAYYSRLFCKAHTVLVVLCFSSNSWIELCERSL